MRKSSSRSLKLSPENKQLLTEVAITDEGPGTILRDFEVLVGDVRLLIGQAMTFLFDFGDRWTFALTLEAINPNDTVREPVILEIHGEPPEQYPRWED